MTLATAIVVIETLFAISPPPIDIVSDKVSGFYVASPTSIVYITDDSINNTTSRGKNGLLSGISDIAFSGQWLYVAIPMKNAIYQYDRYLRYSGQIDTENFSPHRIAVSSDGSLWAYDSDKKEITKYSSVGDPLENYIIPYASSLYKSELIGTIDWKTLENCIEPREAKKKNYWEKIGSVEIATIWSSNTKTITAAIPQDISMKISTEIDNIYICDNYISYIYESNKLRFCGWDTIDWTLPIPENIVWEPRKSGVIIYSFIDDKIIKIKAKWK
ncbi:hypothetical protein DRQ33_04075 [bacterium]|nr:MAG: hypothetical protein DRQ33_04075 [bacterium]